MSEQWATSSPPVPVCYRHPGRETYIRCTRCNRPICPDCMTAAAVGFQCPECVGAGQRATPAARTAFGGSQLGNRGVVTISLIAVNVLVFVGSLALGGVRAAIGQGMNVLSGGVTSLDTALGVVPAAVANGEYYRLVTAMFVHFGVIHIAMNMWALWILGRYLERALGPFRFLALYLVCGIGGNVAVYAFSDARALSAGASTAVFGLFAAIFFVNRKLGLANGPLIGLIVVNLVITFMMPNISIWGHLGGLISGAATGAGLAYAPRSHRTAVQVATLVGWLVLMVVITGARTVTLVA